MNKKIFDTLSLDKREYSEWIPDSRFVCGEKETYFQKNSFSSQEEPNQPFTDSIIYNNLLSPNFIEPFNTLDPQKSENHFFFEVPAIDSWFAERKLREYFSAYPKVPLCIVWGFGEDAWSREENIDDLTISGVPIFWKNFFQWNSVDQDRLTKIFVSYAQGTNRFSLNAYKKSFTYQEMYSAYLQFIAHSLYMEIFSCFPWRLYDYSDEELRWLLHGRWICGLKGYGDTQYSFQKNQFEFCHLEKRFHLGSTEKERYYSLGLSSRPTNPRLLKMFIDKYICHNKYPSAEETISNILSWGRQNLSHGQGLMYYACNYLYPVPVHQSLNLPLTMSQVKFVKNMVASNRPSIDVFLSSLKTEEGTTIVIDQNKLVNDRGIIASRIEEKDKIVFDYNGLHNGCQTAAALLHWLFRSVNIPSRVFPFYTGDTYDPNATHKGIEVVSGKNHLLLPHADDLYIQTTDKAFGNICPINLLDPHVTPVNLLLEKTLYDSWFPSIDFQNLQKNRWWLDGFLDGLYTGYAAWNGIKNGCSFYVLMYWFEMEKGNNLISVPWYRMFLTKPESLPDGIRRFFRDQFLASLKNHAEQRISQIKQDHTSTLWGKTYSEYKSGYDSWLKQLFDKRVKTIL